MWNNSVIICSSLVLLLVACGNGSNTTNVTTLSYSTNNCGTESMPMESGEVCKIFLTYNTFPPAALIVGSVTAPFSIVSNNCSINLSSAIQNCQISVLYTAISSESLIEQSLSLTLNESQTLVPLIAK